MYYYLIFTYQILPNKSDDAMVSEDQNNILVTKVSDVKHSTGDDGKVNQGIELQFVQIHSDQMIVRTAKFTKRYRHKNYCVKHFMNNKISYFQLGRNGWRYLHL